MSPCASCNFRKGRLLADITDTQQLSAIFAHHLNLQDIFEMLPLHVVCWQGVLWFFFLIRPEFSGWKLRGLFSLTVKTLLQMSSQWLSTSVRVLLGARDNGLNSFPKGLFLHGKTHLWQWGLGTVDIFLEVFSDKRLIEKPYLVFRTCLGHNGPFLI